MSMTRDGYPRVGAKRNPVRIPEASSETEPSRPHKKKLVGVTQ